MGRGEGGVLGPPPPTEAISTGSGTILDDPDMLWCEDVWSDEKEAIAKEKLANQGDVIWSTMVDRYEREARKSWDMFYRRHGNNFFKDRHYLDTAFEELKVNETGSGRKKFLEVGCGVGNAFLPLLASNPGLDGVAIDFSPVAIKNLKEKKEYLEMREQRGEDTCVAHVCDVTKDPLPTELDDGCDLVLVLFCLSAISPEKMQTVMTKLIKCLRPGGYLMFRDYGRYDEAQLRFSKGHRLGEHFYVKGDGTRVYYFTTQDVQTLMLGGSLTSLPACSSQHSMSEKFHDDKEMVCRKGSAIMEQLELDYIRRQYANRGQQKARFRVWVHAKFRRTDKPL